MQMAESSPAPIVDAESEAYIELCKGAAGALDMTLPMPQIRQMDEYECTRLRGDSVFRGATEELLVPGVREGNTIPVSVLRPENTTNSWSNVMIYFHGGGWVWGSRNTHREFCEFMAQACNCIIINVEYRLAPEHKFPACYEDAKQVVKWCLANKVKLANNDKCLVGVAGDSAGGNISASVCHMVTGLDYQILIYPCLNLSTTVYPSMLKYGQGQYLLTGDIMKWFLSHFFTSSEDSLNVLASPVLRKSFKGLPPCLMVIAECDPMADHGQDYKNKLDAAGVETELVMLEGVIHGFVEVSGFFEKTKRRTIENIKSFIEVVKQSET